MQRDRLRLWVSNWADKTVARVDAKTAKLIVTVPVGPADTEGVIACSKEAVWMTSGAEGNKVVRIDPQTNTVIAEIQVPDGSHTIDFGEGAI